MKRQILWLSVIAMLIFFCGGCGNSAENDDYKEVSYTVVKTGEIPEEVKNMIDAQEDQAFQMVYQSDGWLYAMRGYGRQKTGGYSIRIHGVGVSGDRLVVESQLIGPQTKEEQRGDGSHPWFVIKLEDPGYPVTFQEAGGEEDGADKEEFTSDMQKK